MKSLISKTLTAVAMVSVMGSAMAVQKDITVTANVDAALDMTQVDNSALPKSVDMQYIPGTGLVPYQLQTKIWANDTAKDVMMQLTSDAVLVNSLGGATVPMSVSWGGAALSTTAVTLKATELFPNPDTALQTGSIAKTLQIAQAKQEPLATGTYQGVVSIYLYQAAAAK
ncbi:MULTISPECIES: CS1 type fimbrial major subunit [Klebsiella]|uniref:CS1 type fimbrial major subunit n=1 Tax=Klebsiella TaxID=570 RepID=UPI000666DD85|nr:CS1 type fimbrial major subunit [Klebsiella michiganensis]ELN3894629.1 fimbrial protein [Klebsiella michiganensis]ELS5412234.1 fimbrial protein [Klebsiella michiganensis]MBZ7103579.1 fimbrial protein [Klebsiella michiganensis]MCW9619399.1 CS1 type fimbrial major subunit [Klebsiella michiganensis]MDU3690268.1 CS1 type fimbrial major subunit [Klebsiella michiganensis]